MSSSPKLWFSQNSRIGFVAYTVFGLRLVPRWALELCWTAAVVSAAAPEERREADLKEERYSNGQLHRRYGINE